MTSPDEPDVIGAYLEAGWTIDPGGQWHPPLSGPAQPGSAPAAEPAAPPSISGPAGPEVPARLAEWMPADILRMAQTWEHHLAAIEGEKGEPDGIAAALAWMVETPGWKDFRDSWVIVRQLNGGIVPSPVPPASEGGFS